jgi:hypothetical protein
MQGRRRAVPRHQDQDQGAEGSVINRGLRPPSFPKQGERQ